MKTKLFYFLITAGIVSCTGNMDNQPLTGTDWGIIPNPSAEEVRSSEVIHWTAESGRGAAAHIYDHISHQGDKSLTVYSSQPAGGRWYTRVNVKPWSVYEFTGWIRTKNLDTERGAGAGFNLAAYGDGFEHNPEPEYFTGDNDWTQVKYQFKTGNQDCLVLECLFNRGGRASGQAWFDEMELVEVKSEALNPGIRIDLLKEGEPMQDYIYGQFIEHLGRCIYGGIWAEMLEDRKFYFAPNDRQAFWEVSPEQALTVDKRNSFVGELTPVLMARNGEQVILSQDGIGVRKDMSYTGRIILKAEGIRKVDVTLSWGNGQNGKEHVTINNPGGQYKEYELKFDADGESDNASLIIEPHGNGSLWVGTVSLMPDDNVEGFRSDVLALLKELNSPVYRWPGGNFVSGYDWKDGLGDPDRRPPRKNPAWTGVEHNDVGIHEFMRFCELLNTEPYIAVNAGLGGVEQARQQVEYCNGDAQTPMGRWRAENGHAEPWKVEWWSIGNEMYGGWQLGHMSTEEFVRKHNEFVDAMNSVSEGMNMVAVGNVGRWDEMMLANCADHMDYISEHFYRQDWHGGGLMTHIRQVPDAIKHIADAHRKYREEIPGLAEKDIRICLDEWNYWYGPHIYGELGTRYFMRDALGVAAGINEFLRQSDIIYMANYAQTVNVIGAIKATDNHAVMAATGQALTMYRKYFGSIPVELEGDQRPLDITAAVTSDHKYLTVSIVNLSWDEYEVPVGFEGSEKFSQVEMIALQGKTDMAYNVPGQDLAVIISEPETIDFNGKLRIKPVEARIYRFEMK